MDEAMKKIIGVPLGGIGIPFKGFSKIRVLDFTQLLPGPYATKILSDMGCRVTKVELPYFADMSRGIPPKINGVGSLYAALSGGKKFLSFDFRKPAGLKRLRRLIERADVLVEGFRPGLMERIGLGYPDVRKINPRIIYCSISGYAPEGPWRRKAGHDLNFQAVSGLLGLAKSDGKIAFPSAQIADVAGSVSAVAAILAALLERANTGRGRLVQIPIADTLHSLLAIPLAHLKATGEDPAKKPLWWNGASPFYRLYETKDGRWVAVAAIEKSFALNLLDVLGLSKLAPLAEGPLDRLNHSGRLIKEISRVFKSATCRQWELRLKDKDVCATPVLTLPEAARFFQRVRY